MESITQCRYSCLYNWKFDGILIPPTFVELIVEDGKVSINGGITVNESDIIRIYSIEPELIELVVTENGIYTPGHVADGYSSVTVNVDQLSSIKSIVQFTYEEGGIATVTHGQDTYSAPDTSGNWIFYAYDNGLYTFSVEYLDMAVSKSLILEEGNVYKTFVPDDSIEKLSSDVNNKSYTFFLSKSGDTASSRGRTATLSEDTYCLACNMIVAGARGYGLFTQNNNLQYTYNNYGSLGKYKFEIDGVEWIYYRMASAWGYNYESVYTSDGVSKTIPGTPSVYCDGTQLLGTASDIEDFKTLLNRLLLLEG